MSRALLLLMLIGLFQSFIFAQSQDEKVSPCHSISIKNPETSSVNFEENRLYETTISGDGDSSKLKYLWTVSGGKILSGQGTKSIIFKPNGLNEFTVKVQLLGESENCGAFSSVQEGCYDCGGVLPTATKISDYKRVSFSKEKRRLNDLAVKLEDVPDLAALIKKSFPRTATKTTIYSSMQRIQNYLISRGIDKRRIFFCQTYNIEDKNEIWIIPVTAIFPDCKGKILDTAKLAEKLKIFKPKTKKSSIKK